MEQLTLITVTVVKLDGSMPYRYSLRVGSSTEMVDIRGKIAEKSGLDSEKLIFVCADTSTLRIKVSFGKGQCLSLARLEVSSTEIYFRSMRQTT